MPRLRGDFARALEAEEVRRPKRVKATRGGKTRQESAKRNVVLRPSTPRRVSW